MSIVKTRLLGDQELPPIGLGAMPMSVEGRPDEARSIAAVHAALDVGIRLVDTADVYALGEHELGHNERVVAKALRGRRDAAIVATKGGLTRKGTDWPHDARPEALRAACEASLRRLETDRIDLYQLHRPDPEVPFAESVGALRELQDAGKVRWVGLSNVTVAQLEEALGIVDVVSVQNELSLAYLEPVGKGEVRACAERGIAFLAWSPLGGIKAAADAGGAHPAVREIAGRRGVSPQRVALRWLLSLGETVMPIPGSSRPETARDSASAGALDLGEEELAAITRDAGLAAT